MGRLTVPSVPLGADTDSQPFSGDVPFPSMEFELLDGLQVSLHPNSSMTHSVLGVHYVLECRDKEGRTAAMKVTFSGRHDGSSGGLVRYLDIEPYRGLPLQCRGKDYGFEFNGKWPSFVPQNEDYMIKSAVPSGGWSIEMPSYSFRHLRLYYEAPYKGSSEADI
jgi:hypothetical protein